LKTNWNILYRIVSRLSIILLSFVLSLVVSFANENRVEEEEITEEYCLFIASEKFVNKRSNSNKNPSYFLGEKAQSYSLTSFFAPTAKFFIVYCNLKLFE